MTEYMSGILTIHLETDKEEDIKLDDDSPELQQAWDDYQSFQL